MVETGLADAGLFCLPEKQSAKDKPQSIHTVVKLTSDKGKGLCKKRPSYCRNCECFRNGHCVFGFEDCSFKGFPVNEKEKKVRKQKCPENCTYPKDGFCMGVCMRKLVADHRKKWKFRYHKTEGENKR